MRTAALRSTAQLTAWRASLLLNGGMFTFMGRYQSAKSVLMCTCEAYFVPISLRRSAGGESSVQSAWPFSICVISASTVSPNE